MKTMKLPHWLRRVISWATENRYRYRPILMKGLSNTAPGIYSQSVSTVTFLS